jgi:putative transposase
MERSLVIDAFQNAVARGRGRLSGLLRHSGQGSQYASADFMAALHSLGVEQSTGRRGNRL